MFRKINQTYQQLRSADSTTLVLMAGSGHLNQETIRRIAEILKERNGAER